jgi:hypothetical protein
MKTRRPKLQSSLPQTNSIPSHMYTGRDKTLLGALRIARMLFGLLCSIAHIHVSFSSIAFLCQFFPIEGMAY